MNQDSTNAIIISKVLGMVNVGTIYSFFRLLIVSLFLSWGNPCFANTPMDLTCDGVSEPLATYSVNPPLGWRYAPSIRGFSQTAFQIQAASTKELLDANTPDLWDTSKVSGTEQQDVIYGSVGTATNLSEKQRVYWRVRAWDQSDQAGAWSSISWFETGINIWDGEWIFLGETMRRVRREFSVSDDISRARLYIACQGLYEAYINGKKAGDHVIAPDTSDSSRRIWYTSLDVTSLLTSGRNAIGIRLGNGNIQDHGGTTKKLLIQLEIMYVNGSTDVIVTDETWSATSSDAITFDHYYLGEQYDARLEDDWSSPGYKPSSGNAPALYPDGIRLESERLLTSGCGVFVCNPEAFANKGDYTITGIFNVEAVAAGLVFRYMDAGNFYMWQFNAVSKELRLHVLKDGAWSVLREVPCNIVVGTDHSFRIEAYGSDIRTYIDDELIDTISDSSHIAGSIGVRQAGGEAAHFDNLKVEDGSLLFSDDFSAGLSNWGNYAMDWATPQTVPVYSARVTINEGNLTLSQGGVITCNTRTLKDGKYWDDYTVSCDVRVLNGAGAVVFRHQDDNNYYICQLDAGQGRLRLYKFIDGIWTLLDDKDLSILVNRTYAVQIDVTGKQIDTYIDGSLVSEITDDSLDSGTVGFASAPTHIVAFDNLEVTYGEDTLFSDAFENGLVKWGNLKLTPQLYPMRVTETLPAISVTEPSPGKYVVDFGQNLTGWVEFTTKGAAGTEVSLLHTELLNSDGTVDPRSAYKQQRETYVLAGTGTEVFRPHFCYHGFRYVEVTGLDSPPAAGDFKAQVIHTDAPRIGNFETSKQILNDVYSAYVWSLRSNMHGIPTDCPTREKRGWTGDAHLVSESGLMTYDLAPFLGKWAYDMDDAIYSTGDIPVAIPAFSARLMAIKDAVWTSARIQTAYDSYMATGRKSLLEPHYYEMSRLIDFWNSVQNGYILSVNRVGDWVSPKGSPKTSGQLLSTAYYYDCVKKMEEIAIALDKIEDAKAYAELANNIKDAFNDKWLHGTYYDNNSQTANALPLAFSMVPEANKQAVLDNLVSLIEQNGDRLETGVVGTLAVMDALVLHGRDDIAYALATQDAYPSWGYMLNQGGTTLREHWEDFGETVSPGPIWDSQNHVMYGGGLVNYLYRSLAGIRATSPGYETFDIKPVVQSDVSYCYYSLETVRGPAKVSWKSDGSSGFSLNCTIPGNSKAKVYIPLLGQSVRKVSINEGGSSVLNMGHATKLVSTVVYQATESGYAVFEVGSGEYAFTVSPIRK